MADSISRRHFLKTSSAAGLAAAALSPAASLAQQKGKARVVIAKDEKCVSSSGTNPVKERIQDMVDYSVMALTGKTKKGEAYEALFPKPVTASTKILFKRNNVSGPGKVNTMVCEALKTGFGTMLEGTFKTSNISIHNNKNSAKSKIDSHDYLINCPVAWCHGNDYGVTLSQKNTMNYLGSPAPYHSKPKKWLYEVSLNAAIKSKQILSMMDAVVGNNQSGPGSSATFAGHSIIMGRDIIAVDYNTIQLMKSKPKASESRMKIGLNQLKAAETAGLGTCTPSKMEVITIGPPWQTGIISDSESLVNPINIKVVNKGNRVEFTVPTMSSANTEIDIFDMTGKFLWHTNNITDSRVIWNTTTIQGSLVPSGMYVYQVKNKGAYLKGVVMISR